MNADSGNKCTVDISVIVPALDEELTIGECIKKSNQYFTIMQSKAK
jgi:hypothetical protein